jgi:hypothetical protein
VPRASAPPPCRYQERARDRLLRHVQADPTTTRSRRDELSASAFSSARLESRTPAESCELRAESCAIPRAHRRSRAR